MSSVYSKACQNYCETSHEQHVSMWSVQDGAQPHFSLRAKAVCNKSCS